MMYPKITALIRVLVLVLIWLPLVACAKGPYAAPGPNDFTVETDMWEDESRDRTVPVKLYIPEIDGDPAIVIFSHGMGGDRDGAAYLGEHLASWGFLSIHVQHPGSDAQLWAGIKGRASIRAALAKASKDPSNAIARYIDIPFVIDTLEQKVDAGELKADIAKIGVAGHSFGAHTVMAVAGFRYITPQGLVSFRDTRITAAAALSPPAPNLATRAEDLPRTYAGITIPVLHLTGTDDSQPFNARVDASDRQIPFSMIGPEPQYLIVFDGGNHAVFSGRSSRQPDPDWYPRVQSETAEATVAFFLTYLTDNADAGLFLNGNGFVQSFQKNATVKRRNLCLDHSCK